MDSLSAIRHALGTPAYDRHNVLLYEDDCLDLLRRMPPGIIDLTVTSPPYNIGKEYEAKRGVAEYIDWCADWIAELYRVAASSGAFWLNLGYLSIADKARAIPIPYLLWDRIPFYLVQEVVWQYGAGVAARLAYSPRNEKFLWYVRNQHSVYFDLDAVRDPNIKYPNQFKNGKRKVNLAGKNPGDVWSFPKVTSGHNRSSAERTSHPAQFPMAVIDRIIKGCSRGDALILDPFMGVWHDSRGCDEAGAAGSGDRVESRIYRDCGSTARPRRRRDRRGA